MKLFDRLGRLRDRRRPYCTMIVPAAGESRRMGGGNKLLLPLEGEPVLAHTLRAIDAATLVDEIILATRTECLAEMAELCRRCGLQKPVRVVVGGETRTHSVLAAALEANEKARLIAVHDGARPLIRPEQIDELIRFGERTYAAAPAVPVTDTVKRAEPSTGRVLETPDRAALFAVQTPQVFQAELLKAALQSAVNAEVTLTDDCSAVERLGLSHRRGSGEHQNHYAAGPASGGGHSGREEETGMTGLRVGHGYDVHRLAQGRPLILGGVTIPWEKGLDGHSDADVLTHAVMDALLGAAGMDDIGRLFPDCDNAFLNISSLTLLERVMKALTEQGWQVVNIDATLVAQAPKIAPYRQEMRCALARTLGIQPEQVNVKATTEEHLGFTGEGLGISAHAVALIQRAES